MPRMEKPKPKIEIKSSQGFVVGDFATVINNFWDEQVLKRFSLIQQGGFILLAFLVIIVGVALFLALQPHKPETMTGDFSIAVATFVENGSSSQKNVGYELAISVQSHLESDLAEINPKLAITVWGPDKVGVITGKTDEDRAVQAAQLAKRIHANMVIYGVVDFDQDRWEVRPEFYISEENFYEAWEVVGQHELGLPLNLSGTSVTAWKYEFGEQMFVRSKVLAAISVGLGYFAVQKYDLALETFQSALKIPDWTDNQGKKVLYAMIGFSAGKAGQYDIAENALNQAIKLDPNYSRPYIGLANLSYMQALTPFDRSKNPKDIDLPLLEGCFKYLDSAEQAREKPPLAEVATKIHFSRGQCYWLKTYAGELPTFALAVSEFQQVIGEYADGKNPHVQELAGEAYARLGLIHNLMGENSLAAQDYQKAADLLEDIPERRDLYQKRVNALLAITPTP